MNIFKFSLKLILQILFVIIFLLPLQAKNLDKFNEGNYISDYFSGILLLNDNKYNESYYFLKKLNGLEESHLDYSLRYLYSLINLGKINEAFSYSKQLERRKLSNFESDLTMGIYYLKNKNLDLAKKYFLKLKKRKTNSMLNNFVSDSLLNWVSFKNLDFNDAQNKINKIESRFTNLKNIQNVFLHCFYNSQKTELFFEKLILKKTDFSRYNYFYATYLSKIGKIEQAKKLVNSSLELYPRNLLLNQYKLDLKNKKYKNNFNCQNLSHVVAELFYITANALSSQRLYSFSNFYLNLSKYLNNDFHSYDALFAENFYNTSDFTQAKKIYKKMSKQGEAFLWYSAKQNAKIFIKEDKKEKALKLISNTYTKLSQKNIYVTYDYAKFLKNNDQFEDAIKLYTKLIEEIQKTHPLYPGAKDGRGVSYERIGEWDKAEADLLSSLDVSPDQAYVINYLAYSWIEKGININKSLKMLKKANNLKSNDPYIIDSLGWALFKLKKYEDSKYYLQSAVKLMPADPVVNDHYGDALWKNGKKIQARYFWNYVLNLKDAEKELKDNIKKKLVSGL